MNKAAKNLHDKTFYALTKHRSFIVGLLKICLPIDMQDKIDWESLKLYRLGSKQVHQDLRGERHADVVYSGLLENTNSLFTVHIEHQSEPSPHIS